jgi:hypothetical protein
MRQAFAAQNDLSLTWQTVDLYQEYPQHPLAQFQTKFEKIFLQQAIKIKAFILRKSPCHA